MSEFDHGTLCAQLRVLVLAVAQRARGDELATKGEGEDAAEHVLPLRQHGYRVAWGAHSAA